MTLKFALCASEQLRPRFDPIVRRHFRPHRWLLLLPVAMALATLLAGEVFPSGGAEAAEPQACQPRLQAELPLIGSGRPMLVAAKIDGSPVTMIVDTGSQWTAVTPDTVRRLGMPADAWHGGLHRGVGSFSNNVNAVARSVEIAGLRLDNRSLSVAPLAFSLDVSPPFAGLLGGDFLFRFDLDIDLPRRRLGLYQGGGCGKAPWGAAAAIPLVKSATNRLNLPVAVDGRPFRAILDTGAGASLITVPNALRAGVAPAALAQDPAVTGRGVGPQPFATRRHVFDDLQIGAEHLRHVEMVVGGKSLGGGDMLLGLDYLARHRVFVSYSTRQMFVAAPGGRDGNTGPSP